MMPQDVWWSNFDMLSYCYRISWVQNDKYEIWNNDQPQPHNINLFHDVFNS
jgi:hypothetical protein